MWFFAGLIGALLGLGIGAILTERFFSFYVATEAGGKWIWQCKQKHVQRTIQKQVHGR
jgi:hypothetical protein